MARSAGHEGFSSLPRVVDDDGGHGGGRQILQDDQFGARFAKWFALQDGDGASSEAWNNLYVTVQEGRKSVRWLKGLTRLIRFSTRCRKPSPRPAIPHLPTSWSRHAWHFDYLAHSHRIKFLDFGEEEYARIFRMPGKCDAR